MFLPLLKGRENLWDPKNLGRAGFDKLREKWKEVPFTRLGRIQTDEVLQWSDEKLQTAWETAFADQACGPNYNVRGWYYTLYRDQFRGKHILDVGSGLGYDAITFARAGARVTCLDLVPSNLQVIRRLAGIYALSNMSWNNLEDLRSIDLLEDDYDVIWACGSLINSPFDFTRLECQKLLSHLKKGGRWIELAYPKIRWEREGRMPFEKWGEKTDGGAPWMEWKDLGKLLGLLEPVRFNVVLNLEFHNSDFNWFDLERMD